MHEVPQTVNVSSFLDFGEGPRQNHSMDKSGQHGSASTDTLLRLCSSKGYRRLDSSWRGGRQCHQSFTATEHTAFAFDYNYKPWQSSRNHLVQCVATPPARPTYVYREPAHTEPSRVVVDTARVRVHIRTENSRKPSLFGPPRRCGCSSKTWTPGSWSSSSPASTTTAGAG